MSDVNKSGGAAFPNPALADGSYRTQPGDMGMTLRDWFAGQALAGFLARESVATAQGVIEVAKKRGTSPKAVAAALAYEHADAMIAAREAGQ